MLQGQPSKENPAIYWINICRMMVFLLTFVSFSLILIHIPEPAEKEQGWFTMKKGVMLLLILAGLTKMGTIQVMGDATAEQAKSAVYSGYSGPDGNNKELLKSGTFHSGTFHEDSYGNPGTVFPSIASSQPSMTIIRKTLKGYSSMKRSTYLIELMQLV